MKATGSLWTITLVGLTAARLSFVVAGQAADRTGKEKPSMVLENAYVRYAIAADGTSASFVDKGQKKEYLAAEGGKAFMTITKDGKGQESTSLSFDAGKEELTVGFGDTGVVARFKVRTKPHYFTFELTDLAGDQASSVSLCQLPLSLKGLVGEVVGVARDERFAAGVQAMNLKMEAGANAHGQGALLWVKDSPKYGPLVGAKFALFGCPAKRALETIGEIEVGEGLPHPMLAGKWGKVSPEATKSYLIIDVSEQNTDEVLRYAQAGGFTYLYHPGPFATWGHWPLYQSAFPKGYAGLNAISQKANKLGIKIGVHHLSGGITTNDPYVTPVPDPRLEKYGTATLAADLNEKATTLFVRDPQGRFGATNIIQVGLELIQYKSSSAGNPMTLTDCVRGLYGTRSTEHAAGATVSTLVINSYNGFVPEPDSALLQEMGERMANIINDCELNQLSFDGWEWHAYNKGQYGMNKYLDAVSSRWKREVICDASGVTHWGWHVFTRMNWGELTQSARVDVDEYRARNCEFFERNLMPKALGWWRLGLAGCDWEATPLEDIEYLLAKAAGWGGCHALTTSLGELKAHGLTEKALALTKAWDEARYADAFTEKQRVALHERGRDFHLETVSKGQWRLIPVRYSASYWCKGAEADQSVSFASAGTPRPGNRCEIANPFAEQPLRFQLRALPAFDYDHAENLSLMPASPSDLSREPGLHKEAPTIAAASADPLHSQPAMTLTAKYEGDKPSYVTRVVCRLPKPLNLMNHRGLGMWVRGDGKGELFLVELQAVGGSVRQYYVPVDFTGERYVEFPNGEMSLSRYYDYNWNNWSGFASWWVTLKGFDYGRVAVVTMGFNSIPPKSEVSCTVAGLKALKELNAPLINPRFTLGGNSLTFPVSLQPQQYLVSEGDGNGLAYDPNWHLLQTVTAEGAIPKLAAGTQTMDVEWETKDSVRPWGRVKLKVIGPAEMVTTIRAGGRTRGTGAPGS